MAHSDVDTQGILANQDINGFVAPSAASDDTNLANKWHINIRGRDYPNSTHMETSTTQWNGYAYTPEGLEGIMPGDVASNAEGPRDYYFNGWIDDQYGPPAFGRAATDDPTGKPVSLLSAFSSMIGHGSASWGTHARAVKMETTFTSGSQIRSLWDKSDIHGVPIASGGAFNGYESAESRRYGQA